MSEVYKLPQSAEEVEAALAVHDLKAAVGQTIVVEEVDANGKPTKWKAAEYQPRTHWSEEGKVQVSAVPIGISTLNSTYGAFTFMVLFNEYVESLPISAIASIEYDGVEYTDLPSFNYNDMQFFGNLYFLNATFGTTFGDTGEPFVLASTSGGTMVLTTDTETTRHSIQIYINGTHFHRINRFYQPELPVIDITAYTLNKDTFTAVSGDDYYEKIYRVLMTNDMVKIVYTDGEHIYTASCASIIHSTKGFVNLKVEKYSQDPGVMIFATDTEASVMLT